jgi:hypothetical protein
MPENIIFEFISPQLLSSFGMFLLAGLFCGCHIRLFSFVRGMAV